MGWTADERYRAAMLAPTHRVLLRADTQVIERPGWHQLVTPSAPGSLLNEVVRSELAADEADGVIADVVAMYAATGHPTKWCVGPWTEPADFGARLERAGFTSWNVRGMAIDTARVLPAGAVVVDEVDETEIDAYVDVMMRGWATPAEQSAAERDSHRRAMRASPRQVHFFVARAAGDIIGTAAVAVLGDHGYLLATQVLSAFRGRGAYRALVAARLAFLVQRGIALAVTQAREATSAPILERLGFETVFRSQCYLRPIG